MLFFPFLRLVWDFVLLIPSLSPTMPLLFSQQEGNLVLPSELKEPVLLPEVLRSTTFVSGNGRIYRLFGNEDEAFAIPPIPPLLAAPKTSVLSLEEALQQIESFSSPATSKNESEQSKSLPIRSGLTIGCTYQTADTPTLQLFRAFGESAVPRLVRRENLLANESIPAKEIIYEVSQSFQNPALEPSAKTKHEMQKSLRIAPEYIEEPFIVPFVKPAISPEETETNNTALEGQNDINNAEDPQPMETMRPIHYPKILRKYRQRSRKDKTPYRKQFFLSPVCFSQQEESLVITALPTPPDISAFRWSEQVDSLMRTADYQIRMLADHLVVQSNQGIKVICFKSVFSGDGCSTILLCAVRSLMERGYRILLVDAHHRHIDLPNQLNMLENLDTEDDVMILNDHLGLLVWQESKTVTENTTILADNLTAHREKYDLILLDNGSLMEGPLTEFVEFWNQIMPDGVVLVSNTKHPPEVPVSHIACRLRQNHIHLIGITENYV